MSNVPYARRNMDVQIRIDNLMSAHGGKYPLSWYEQKSDIAIREMHSTMMSRYAQSIS